MRASVVYIHLNDTDAADINREGWEGETGRAYDRLKEEGIINSRSVSMLKTAASLDADSAEDVYIRMQNMEDRWEDDFSITCHTDAPRSMDVGDFIFWEDGRIQRCAMFGFDDVRIIYSRCDDQFAVSL